MDRGGTWTFYEFFAGGGMARAGLGPAWRCLFANDIDKKKAESYRANWRHAGLSVKDVADVSAEQLLGQADSLGLPFLVRTFRLLEAMLAWPVSAPAPSGHSGVLCAHLRKPVALHAL